MYIFTVSNARSPMFVFVRGDQVADVSVPVVAVDDKVWDEFRIIYEKTPQGYSPIACILPSGQWGTQNNIEETKTALLLIRDEAERQGFEKFRLAQQPGFGLVPCDEVDKWAPPGGFAEAVHPKPVRQPTPDEINLFMIALEQSEMLLNSDDFAVIFGRGLADHMWSKYAKVNYSLVRFVYLLDKNNRSLFCNYIHNNWSRFAGGGGLVSPLPKPEPPPEDTTVLSHLIWALTQAEKELTREDFVHVFGSEEGEKMWQAFGRRYNFSLTKFKEGATAIYVSPLLDYVYHKWYLPNFGSRHNKQPKTTEVNW